VSYKESPTSDVEVKHIEAIFKTFGIDVVRYASLEYLGNIDEFMKRVRTTSFALLFINKAYLESLDTMSQVLQLQKDENYKNRMTLLIHTDVDIYGSAAKVLPYYKFWEEQFSKYKKVTENTPTEAAGSLAADAKQLSTTKNEISDFISNISKLKVPTYEELKSLKFLPILKLIIARTIVDPN